MQPLPPLIKNNLSHSSPSKIPPNYIKSHSGYSKINTLQKEATSLQQGFLKCTNSLKIPPDVNNLCIYVHKKNNTKLHKKVHKRGVSNEALVKLKLVFTKTLKEERLSLPVQEMPSPVQSPCSRLHLLLFSSLVTQTVTNKTRLLFVSSKFSLFCKKKKKKLLHLQVELQSNTGIKYYYLTKQRQTETCTQCKPTHTQTEGFSEARC